MQYRQFLALGIVASLLLSSASAFAGGGSSSSGSAGVSDEYIPVQNHAVWYSFDSDTLAKLVAQKSSLYRVKCRTTNVLSAIGIDSLDDTVFSVGFTDGDFDYNIDIRNCSLWANNTKIQYGNNDTITDTKAIDMVNVFLRQSTILSNNLPKIGTPIIVGRGMGSMIPMMTSEVRSSPVTPTYQEYFDATGVTIDEGSGDILEREYSSVSIVVPFIIGNAANAYMYQSYNAMTPMGISFEVTPSGITSINTQLMKFSLVRMKSELMTLADMTQFISVGGLSSYYDSYGNQGGHNIVFTSMEKAFIFFPLYRNGKNDGYISTGIRFVSDTFSNPSDIFPYATLASAYKIGNNYNQ